MRPVSSHSTIRRVTPSPDEEFELQEVIERAWRDQGGGGDVEVREGAGGLGSGDEEGKRFVLFALIFLFGCGLVSSNTGFCTSSYIHNLGILAFYILGLRLRFG